MTLSLTHLEPCHIYQIKEKVNAYINWYINYDVQRFQRSKCYESLRRFQVGAQIRGQK